MDVVETRIEIDGEGRIKLPASVVDGVSSFGFAVAANGDIILTPYVEVRARDLANSYRVESRASPDPTDPSPRSHPFTGGGPARTDEEMALIADEEWDQVPLAVQDIARRSRNEGTPTAIGQNEAHGWFVLHRGDADSYVAWSEKRSNIRQHFNRWVDFSMGNQSLRFTVLKRKKAVRIKKRSYEYGRTRWSMVEGPKAEEARTFLEQNGYLRRLSVDSNAYCFGERLIEASSSTGSGLSP